RSASAVLPASPNRPTDACAASPAPELQTRAPTRCKSPSPPPAAGSADAPRATLPHVQRPSSPPLDCLQHPKAPIRTAPSLPREKHDVPPARAHRYSDPSSAPRSPSILRAVGPPAKTLHPGESIHQSPAASALPPDAALDPLRPATALAY